MVCAVRDVVLMGPPGAGKGSHARLLHGREGLQRLSIGDVLRAEVSRCTPRGRRIQERIDAGCFAEDDVVLDLVGELLLSRPSAGGYLLDGFPRNLAQARVLDEILGKIGGHLARVVLLDAPEDVLLSRLTGRRICSQCDAIFHVQLRPPRRTDTCDRCDHHLSRRPDDATEIQLRRLRTYERVTRPILEYYEERNLLLRVDASGSLETVSDRILGALFGS